MPVFNDWESLLKLLKEINVIIESMKEFEKLQDIVDSHMKNSD